MRGSAKDNLTLLILAVVAFGVLWFILSRIHIVLFTYIPWWVLGLLILIPIAVILLVIDHFID